jgi:hypothetical protein
MLMRQLSLWECVIDVSSTVSKDFFNHEYVKAGKRCTYLITRAITKTLVLVSEVLHPSDVCYHMKVGKFVTQLTRRQREQFSNIVKDTFDISKIIIQGTKITNNGVITKSNKQDRLATSSGNFMTPSLPMTPLFLDHVYIRGENSLLENLPRPTVEVVDNHAYVDIIIHLLSFSSCYNYMATSSNSFTIGQGLTKDLHCNEKAVVLACTEWSDDFDPSLSTKSNRQSCWTKTVTIMSFNEADNNSKVLATFPIAVGKKGHCHEWIES